MTLQLLNIRITNSTRRNLKFENSILSWAVGLVQCSAQHSHASTPPVPSGLSSPTPAQNTASISELSGSNCVHVAGHLGLGDSVPGDLHRHLHALRGRLPPQRARLQRPVLRVLRLRSNSDNRSYRWYHTLTGLATSSQYDHEKNPLFLSKHDNLETF